MEKINNEELGKILSDAELKEKQNQRRTIIFTIIPFVLGIVFLLYSSLAVYDKTKEMELQKRELDSLSVYVASLKNSIRVLEDSIQKSVDFTQYLHKTTPLTAKYIYSVYPRQAQMIDYIFHLKESGVSWYLGGQNPSVGFDSPNFALHILKHVKQDFNLPQGAPNETLSDRLLKTLSKTETPEAGDVIFYPGGYVLFYFIDENNTPFVIGMTPRGIVSLKSDFAKIVGVRKSGV